MRKKSLGALITQDPSAAIRALERELQASPQDAYAWYLMGKAVFRMDRFSEASEHFKHASKLNRNHPMTYFYIGLSSERLKSIPEAVQAYRRAYELNGMKEARDKIIHLTGVDPGVAPTAPPKYMPVRHGHADPNLQWYGRPRPLPGSNRVVPTSSGKFGKVLRIVIWTLVGAMFVGIGTGALLAWKQRDEDRKIQCQQVAKVFEFDRLPPDCQRILRGQ
jgi:tetratricopeptide (TPR) repeat protein